MQCTMIAFGQDVRTLHCSTQVRDAHNARPHVTIPCPIEEPELVGPDLGGGAHEDHVA
eukprot:SAG25_NODE_14120_length_259_cov_0.537500_1_plen_57_part_01